MYVYAHPNKSGAFALLFPLEFQFVSGNFSCSLLDGEKKWGGGSECYTDERHKSFSFCLIVSKKDNVRNCDMGITMFDFSPKHLFETLFVSVNTY
jgi:hypothetical protein